MTTTLRSAAFLLTLSLAGAAQVNPDL